MCSVWYSCIGVIAGTNDELKNDIQVLRDRIGEETKKIERISKEKDDLEKVRLEVSCICGIRLSFAVLQEKADAEFSLKSITNKLQQFRMKEEKKVSSSSLLNSPSSESASEAEGGCGGGVSVCTYHACSF